MKLIHDKIALSLLFVASVALEGGVASGWWPPGWPQPLLVTVVLVAAWWLPVHWHTALSLASAGLLDSLQGRSDFPTTRLVCVMVILISLVKLNPHWQPSRRQINWLLAGWLLILPLVQLQRQAADLAWPAKASFGLQVALGIGLGWWVVHRLGEPSWQ